MWLLIIGIPLLILWFVAAFMVHFFSLPWWFCWLTGWFIGVASVGTADMILNLIHRIRIKILMKRIRREFKQFKEGKK